MASPKPPPKKALSAAPGQAPLQSHLLSASSGDSESMQKLRALQERIAKEWEEERKERQEAESREVIVPASLADDYAQHGSKKGTLARRQLDRPALLTREKIASLKLDKAAQRELEAELDRKSTEMQGLRAHNQRLREIIRLRQESNMRKEQEIQGEVVKLKDMSDTVSVDVANYNTMMESLRDMNRQIQEGVTKLKANIEEHAESDRLALIRRYRVRMREVKQLLNEQERANLAGAKAWIDRHRILKRDFEAAEEGLKELDAKITVLVAENKELRVMTRHQEEQRENLTGKIAVVKRENKRIEDQIKALELKMVEQAHRQPESSNPTRLTQSRHSRSSQSQRAATAGDQRALSVLDRKQVTALQRVKRSLEAMRRSLKQVRGAHIELLQERTELEVFLRQCMEDVRRDMYRFTVVNTVSRSVKGDRLEEKNILQDYGAKERKHLINILNSKLKVLTVFHEKAFPYKPLSEAEVLGEFAGESDKIVGDGLELPQQNSAVTDDVAAELDMDTLWQRWKQWNAGVLE